MVASFRVHFRCLVEVAFVELELIGDEGVLVESRRQLQGLADAHLEVEVFLAQQLTGIALDEELLGQLSEVFGVLWFLVFTVGSAVRIARLVLHGQASILSSCSVDGQDRGVELTCTHESESTEREIGLANQDWVGWVPERILVLRQLGKHARVKELVEDFTDHEDTVLEFLGGPLVEVPLLVVVDLDDDVSGSLRQRAGLQERVHLFDQLGVEFDVSLQLGCRKVRLVYHRQNLVKLLLDPIVLGL